MVFGHEAMALLCIAALASKRLAYVVGFATLRANVLPFLCVNV
jgi:hypothetical protein